MSRPLFRYLVQPLMSETRTGRGHNSTIERQSERSSRVSYHMSSIGDWSHGRVPNRVEFVGRAVQRVQTLEAPVKPDSIVFC